MTDEPVPPPPGEALADASSSTAELAETTEPASTADAIVAPDSAAQIATPEPIAPDPIAAGPSPSEVLAAVPPPPIVRQPLWFLALVSLVSLAIDLGSKAWAKQTLDDPHVFPYKKIDVIKDHLSLVFAKNKGGAWGLLQDENENLRRPFFLLISAAAVIFIVTLYRKLTPKQTALKWGFRSCSAARSATWSIASATGTSIDFIDVHDWKGERRSLADLQHRGRRDLRRRRADGGRHVHVAQAQRRRAAAVAGPGFAGEPRARARRLRRQRELSGHAPRALPAARRRLPVVLRPAPLRLRLRDRARRALGAAHRQNPDVVVDLGLAMLLVGRRRRTRFFT